MRALSAFAVLSALLAQSCAKRQEAVRPGVTSCKELIQTQGQPQREEQSSLRPQAKLMDYPDKARYQCEQGVVVATSRKPEPDEQDLQTWLQRWKKLPTLREPVQGTLDPHGKSKMQLIAPFLGLAVIYDGFSGIVESVERFPGAR